MNRIIKKADLKKTTLLYFPHIVQILRTLHVGESLPISSLRDDFILENIKKLKITVQIIIIKINEIPAIFKAIFKKIKKALFWVIIVITGKREATAPYFTNAEKTLYGQKNLLF